MSETPLVRAIIDTLNESRIATVWRNQSGALHGGRIHLAPEGTPDIVGFDRRGVFVGLEVKAPGGRTKPDRLINQAMWRDRIRIAGGITAEVRSVEEAVSAVLAGSNR